MKKIFVIGLLTVSINAFSWEGSNGFSLTPLGEIGFFSSINFVYFGAGSELISIFTDEDSWWDLTFRLGGTYVFKYGIGALAGLQYKLLAVESMGGLSSYSSAGGYSGTVDWEYTSIFMPEIGVSYQWKSLYGNVVYQFDTLHRLV